MSNIKSYKYHYFYKITNKFTNQYYFGIHSTNNLNDNYMGSGTLLKREYRKYGKEYFIKEIIKFFDNRQELIDYEQKIVNENILNDPFCLNIIKGGIAGLETGFTVGLVTVRDANGNCFDVKCNDSRYISGELTFVGKNQVTVRDKFGKTFKVHISDPRYISGELTIISKGNKAGSGRTYVMKNGICKFILKEELQMYLNDGWIQQSLCKGRISPTKGMIWVCRDDKQILIKPEELQMYLNDGWIRTRITKPLKDTICITKDGEKEKFIKPEELQMYLNDGWDKKGKSRNKGKVTVFDPLLQKYIQVDKTDSRYISGELKTKLQIQNTNAKDTKYMNKDGKVKRIKFDKIDEYLKMGWSMGMNPKNSK